MLIYLKHDDRYKKYFVKELNFNNPENIMSLSNSLSRDAVRNNDDLAIELAFDLQIIEDLRNDYRDNLQSFAMIKRSCEILDIDYDGLMLARSKNSSERFREFILSFLRRPPDQKTLKVMGYQEIFEPHFNYVPIDRYLRKYSRMFD